MRVLAIAATCAALVAGPALARDGGNVGQPSQTVPQTGQTTGGTRDNMPGMTTGTVTAPAGEGRMAPGAVDSAKGGNAAQTNKPAPNTGATSGGPAR